MPSFLTRRTILAAALMLTTTAVTAQSPGVGATFTQAAFNAAQVAGKPIVLEVAAPWCPVCKAQAPIINSLLSKPEFRNVTVLKIDFDNMKDILKTFNVSKQSTLIAFKGKTETSRTTGDTSADGIEKLFKSAI